MDPFEVVTSELAPGIWKLNIGGTVDHLSVPRLKETFGDFFKRGIYSFVVNLKSTEYVTSAGIACFLTILDLTSSHNGRLVFIAAPYQIQRIAEILGLSEVFKFVDDEATALKSILRQKPG